MAAFALCLVAVLLFAPSLEALRPLCGGRKATIATNDRVIRGGRGPDVILAGKGPNLIYGGRGNDTICAGPGRDRIFGGRGNDTIDGKRGNDSVRGDRGSDELDGGTDRDRVLGGSGNDTVRGGPGNRDELDGGPGDDGLDGGGGAFDSLLGGIGRDTVDGGPGRHDIASYRGVGGAIQVDLALGRVSGAEAERLVRVEDVLGGTGEDVLKGSPAAPNRLDGGPGDDSLIGGRHGDRAYGGPGSDLCVGPFALEASCGPAAGRGAGTRVELYRSISGAPLLTIAGDVGADDIVVARGRGGYLVRPRGGAPLLLGPQSLKGCRYRGTAVLCGGRVGAVLAGLGEGDDSFAAAGDVPSTVSLTVDGGPGRDRVRGARGADTLYAGDDGDPDLLAGGGGNDALFGVNILHPRHPSGRAVMLGGAGDDLLIGGQPCADRFHGGRGANDSASFARVRNPGVVVEATIAGPARDPDVGGCGGGRIDGSVEKIEGSPGRDVLAGSAGADVLLGRGGADSLDGRGGADRCIGGRGVDGDRRCEYAR